MDPETFARTVLLTVPGIGLEVRREQVDAGSKRTARTLMISSPTPKIVRTTGTVDGSNVTGEKDVNDTVKKEKKKG